MVLADEHGTFAKVEVDPKSIGKCLRGITGSLIFEGDCFQVDEDNWFVIMDADTVFTYAKDKRCIAALRAIEICWDGCVLAGNVYENPS